MTVMVVPSLEEAPWPTLGAQVCDFIESYLVFGPGDLRGEPARLDDEKRALLYRMYEVYPRDHPQSGRRRFKRVALSLRKGSAKTEYLAWIAAAELHQEGPVRTIGWDGHGNPIGGPVNDPYIPMVAYTEEQSEELAYGALLVILQYSQIAKDFDIGLARIMRISGDGKAVALATAPDARDGARTTFQAFDEPLALDTPVPTLAGWKILGEIGMTDKVYGRNGQPVPVLGFSPIHEDRPCYRVTFNGGDSIVTDGGHRWTVIGWHNRSHGEQVRTTEEMYKLGVDTGYGKRWRLPRANGYDGIEQELPVEPYLLGLWLGDGDSRNATISVGVRDVAETEQRLGDLGYIVTRCSVRGRAPLIYVTTPDSSKGCNGKSIVGALRKMGLLHNKHIPAPYMIASREQRLSLLQGLMDADGYVTSNGNCTFVQGRREMVEAVQLLVRSLGIPATITSTVDSRSRTGVMCKVHFTPYVTPFRLKRKAALCRSGNHINWVWPTIINIEPCESVPVRCLAVGTEDHLFLVGTGLRLTHNTHRFTLPRLREAHRTMMANIPKRKLADAWSLETTTAPAPGENSVAESTMEYARMVESGKIVDSRLFFFHRQASDKHDLGTPEGIRAAVIEASGPVAEWSDIEGIVGQWADPTSDKSYLERVWLNRLVRSAERAFDAEKWKTLARPEYQVADDTMIVVGFDGARYHDATALIATEVATGYQWPLGIWECPPNIEGWEVPEAEVEAAIEEAFTRWNVWRMYADPPYWETHVAKWAGQYGDKCVLVWRTNRKLQMASAVRSYNNAIQSGELTHDGSQRFAAHIGAACRRVLTLRDEKGEPLWTIYKERTDSPHKIDAAVAGCLSWEARCDAIAAGMVAVGQSVYEERGLISV